MITDNIVAEFKDLDDAKHMVQVTPKRWRYRDWETDRKSVV